MGLPPLRKGKDTEGVPGSWDGILGELSPSPGSSVTLCLDDSLAHRHWVMTELLEPRYTCQGGRDSVHPSTRYSGRRAGGISGHSWGTSRKRACMSLEDTRVWLSLAEVSWRQAEPQPPCEHLIYLMSQALIFRGGTGWVCRLVCQASPLWEKVLLHASMMEVVGHGIHTSPDSKNSPWWSWLPQVRGLHVTTQ